MPVFRSDRALLDRFRAGVPDAIRIVYWEYVGKVERLVSGGFEIRSRGTRVPGAAGRVQDVEDLVQETFIRAFSSKGRLGYDGLRDYGPYLFAIARNVLVDWARASGREIPIAGTDIGAAIDATTLSEHAPAQWADPRTMRIVEDYLRRIPSDLREVHRLRYEENLSQHQVAERLMISRQSVRTLEARLREGLSAALAAEDL